MEPAEARLMVPCFDEPAFKAPWNVTVIHPKGTTAISNNLELKTEKNGDWVTTTFHQTPKMSSYLLALMVSEFTYAEKYTESGVRFFFTLYVSFSDMVALPDFTSGAMENWGMITYRENNLLYDDKLYGPESKRRIAQVVAHELGHMHYIKKFAYDNAEAADLWTAFDEVVGGVKSLDNMKVLDYADEWTSQMAFPLVTVERSDSNRVKLTQNRYLKTPKTPDPKRYRNPKYGFKWDIPIWYQAGNGEEKFAWLRRSRWLDTYSKILGAKRLWTPFRDAS
ncbi:unnamed protein product [Strongylus vulgaris]|uniref:Uncharacterized protein n=1 Tax=Strongylus vulgaris TaxID=40348 RepID=A0A3P7LAD2_STRVU|nr:unnamed protein product [Strongylus vulgaris]